MALTEMLETSISSPISTGPELEDPKGQKRDEETTISVRPIGAQKVDSALTGTKHTAQEATKDSWLKKMIDEAGSLPELKKRIEFEAIANALREEKGNITRAAKRLGMKRPRLSQIIHSNPKLGELKQGLTDSE